MYKCSVIYSSERKEKEVRLDIIAPPQVTITGKTVVLNTESILRCSITGFYPVDIDIKWFKDEEKLNKIYVGDSWRNPDRTYNVDSTVTITPTEEDRERNFSCRVQHKYLQEPLQEDFQLVYEDRSSAGIIAACTVIVLILIILLTGVLWWKRKLRSRGNVLTAKVPFIGRDIKGPPKLIVGEEATLYYTVDTCPENLCVTWLIRSAGQVQEIQTSQMRGHSEEEESLLDTSYVIKSQREGHQYLSSLSFIPHMERHKDVTFLCRGVSSQHNDEKTFHCKTIYGKPKMSHPVMRSLLISGEIKYLLNLENFYPKSIKIVWTCVVGRREEVLSSIESSSHNPDRSYNVSSEVRIPEDRHKDPGFRVRVTWEHGSMDNPESRELSIRDSDHRWRPVIEEIQIPRLLRGTPATLQCQISGYFPDAVAVKWMRRAGDQLYEETDAADNQRITSRRAADNTYSCTACLTITPTLQTHQGAEYICVVEHPSLENPIEKSTGTLQVIGKPKMSHPVIRSLFVSGEMKYVINLEKFYPKSIKIVWKCGVGGEEVLSSTESPSHNPDRSYNVSSEVRITEDRHKDPGFRVRVTWEHESMDNPESRELSIRDSDYRWIPVIEEIQIPRQLHGTPGTLQCNISGYFPDAVAVKWMRRAGYKLTEENDAAGNQRITSRRAVDNTYSCTARLTITPKLQTHQGAEYICLVEHPSLENPIEKSTGTLQVIATPQMLDPIEITMADSSRVQFSLNLQKFYPKDIKISWHWENTSRKYELSAAETFRTQEVNLTYDVTSVVRISNHSFNDPEIKIIVAWKHEAMETPETRSLSIRDLPWRPHIESINVPELEDGKETTLTCNISGYFPDHLSVIWSTKKDGDATALPIESLEKDRTYKISEKKKEQKDKTYSCEASLTFTPLKSSDQGSEIICRVEHPSLEDPLGISIGPLQIGVKKQNIIVKAAANTAANAVGKWFKGIFTSDKKIILEDEVTEDTGAEPGEETEILTPEGDHGMSSLELTGPSVHTARLGSDALVSCPFTVDKPPVDPKHLIIFWHFRDKEILSYNNTVRTTSPRYSLNTDALITGSANLTVSNIQIPDGGTYKCSVIYSSERKDKEIRLDIGAPPQVTITGKTVVMNKESVLRCSITRFYPVDIDIRWFRGREMLSNVTVETPRRNPDRTYNVNSTVTITVTEEDRQKTFSCRIRHEFLQAPLQEDFRLVSEDRSSAVIIAACTVIMLILMILIAGALWWKLKRRSRGKVPFIVRDIEGPPKLIDGEEATLYYTVDTCPENLCVTWLIRSAGQVQEIQTSQMRGHSEEGESLLDKSYVIKSQREGRQYLSSLSFIPHRERHKDVTFLCRGVSSQHNDEKTFHCKTIYVSSLELTGPSVHAARLGSDALVSCPFTVDKPPVDPKHLIIFWHFRDKEILSYNNTVRTTSPRYSLSTDALITGSANLTVSNIQIPDGGMYKCSVIYSSERKDKEIRLDIGAPPQVTITGKTVVMNKESVLRCSITRFYPVDIDIRWFRDGEMLSNVTVETPRRNPDRTYNVNSTVTITVTEEDRQKTFSCRIRHEFLQAPLQEDFRLVSEDRSSAVIIAACTVIMLILIILIAGALWWKLKRRSRGKVPFIVRDIEGPPKLIDGEEATLYCTVDTCPENLCVTWLIRSAGQVQEIQTSQMRGHSEEGESLLDKSYVIKSQREGHQNLSSLRFIPHMERHKDVTFLCRGVSSQHNDEKTFHCKTIYGKPKMSHPVMRSLLISGEMKYLLNLEKFYPESIKIEWTCGVGGGEEVLSSTESPSHNPDRSYNVSSEVRIPEDGHKDPGFRVRVTWEHESMDNPESRELSIRDSDHRWRPVIEEILIPRLLRGTPATLQCQISGYFPDTVAVKWMRRAGYKSYEEAAGNQRITSRRAADNTYSCTARLTITPTLQTHQGAEYICLVEHPTLENPIEKSTGMLQVIGKPKMSHPVMRSLLISGDMKYVINLEKFSPKSIKIVWTCGVGREEEVLSSNESPSHNPDRSYNVSSEVRIPRDRHKDPGFRVRVTWEHESMDNPESTELSIRDSDYRWRPVIEEIQIPHLLHGAPATLQCKISGYFPDAVAVKWRRAGYKLYEETDAAGNQRITSRRAADNTYSYTARLTITPRLQTHQGAEYICLVEHPSLENPIEKSTGTLQVIAEEKSSEKQSDCSENTGE
ncbi:uncharacterized protein LOC142656004 isoform X2 [Rhinoderma darwinii]|uniref:uncharacterized protein LOC142656004 isoform X2 n=1 Tax=Rhinoderma darwinii TaxID=43563 RepID=UPI003F673868